jgi:hypothetical protein
MVYQELNVKCFVTSQLSSFSSSSLCGVLFCFEAPPCIIHIMLYFCAGLLSALRVSVKSGLAVCFAELFIVQPLDLLDLIEG